MAVKKWVKRAGNVLMLLALVLIVRRLAGMDIDYAILLRRDNLFLLAVLVLLYGINVVATSLSWYIVVQIVTGKRLPFLPVQYIFCRAGLLKYLPGNVFQYVGRNELAVQYELPHKEVALSTVLDVAANMAGVCLVALSCYAAGLQTGLQSIASRIGPRVIVIAALAVLVVCLVAYKLRHFLLEKLRVLFTAANMARYAFCIVWYALLAIYNGALYLTVLTRILHVGVEGRLLFIVIGAYQLAWLLGFLVPGAPGGLGIRETVIVALLAAWAPQEPVLLAIVIFRIISTVGDFTGLLLNRLFVLIKKHITPVSGE